jgi:signal peptidase I
MYPTLQPGNHIEVEEPAGTVQRADIVVFSPPPSPIGPQPSDVVKRVIGLPGEVIGSRNGHVTINGAVLSEPYLPAKTLTTDFKTVAIPQDEYFVIGDNRTNSQDSRFYGPIANASIVGKMTGYASRYVDTSESCTP